MAILLEGDREVVNRYLFGEPPQAFQQYLQETQNYFRNTLTDVGQQLVQVANQTFQRMDLSSAMEAAKHALRQSNIFFQQDVIYPMQTVEELQEAPDTMVRWIMAHPTLREHYQQGHIDGYGNRYIDYYPQQIGWDHQDYYQVHNGWINVVQEDDEAYEEFVETLALEEDYDTKLDLFEQACILQAHELVDVALDQNRDPTSYYDNRLL